MLSSPTHLITLNLHLYRKHFFGVYAGLHLLHFFHSESCLSFVCIPVLGTNQSYMHPGITSGLSLQVPLVQQSLSPLSSHSLDALPPALPVTGKPKWAMPRTAHLLPLPPRPPPRPPLLLLGTNSR